MDIHLRPDQEYAILEAIKVGLIKNELDALDLGLDNLRDKLFAQVSFAGKSPKEAQNNLADIFSSVRGDALCGDDIDFARNNSTGRLVDL